MSFGSKYVTMPTAISVAILAPTSIPLKDQTGTSADHSASNDRRRHSGLLNPQRSSPFVPCLAVLNRNGFGPGGYGPNGPDHKGGTSTSGRYGSAAAPSARLLSLIINASSGELMLGQTALDDPDVEVGPQPGKFFYRRIGH
jgi:hypothetical protein